MVRNMDLMTAIDDKNIARFRAVLATDESQVILNHRHANGLTPLLRATQLGKCEVMEALLVAGADPDANSGSKRPVIPGFPGQWAKVAPIHMALCHGAPVMNLLARYGANMNAATEGGRTAVFLASWNGRPQTIAELAKLGADVNQASDDGQHPMSIAASWGHTKCIQALIAAGADMHEVGAAALDHAVQRGHTKCAEVIRVAQPLQLATPAGGLTIASLEGHAGGLTPLLRATQQANLDVMQELLKMGADPTRTSGAETVKVPGVLGGWAGVGPIHMAVGAGAEAVQVLVDAGADINATTACGHTPAHLAVQGHADLLPFIVDLGGDLNAPATDGTRPIHMAARRGDLHAVQTLAGLGADLSVPVKHRTAAALALKAGHSKCAAFLRARAVLPGVLARHPAAVEEAAAIMNETDVFIDAGISEILPELFRVSSMVASAVNAICLGDGATAKTAVGGAMTIEAGLNLTHPVPVGPLLERILDIARTVTSGDFTSAVSQCVAVADPSGLGGLLARAIPALGKVRAAAGKCYKGVHDDNPKTIAAAYRDLPGCDVGGLRQNGLTMLEHACSAHHKKAFIAILHAGHEPATHPLHLAVASPTILTALLNVKKDPAVQRWTHVDAVTNNATPLLAAVRATALDAIETLLKAGADPTLPSVGTSALDAARTIPVPHVAAAAVTSMRVVMAGQLAAAIREGDGGAVARLLAADASLANPVDEGVEPPLMIAVRSNNLSLVSALLTAGANPHRMYRGKTPIEAMHRGNVMMAAMLTPPPINQGLGLPHPTGRAGGDVNIDVVAPPGSIKVDPARLLGRGGMGSVFAGVYADSECAVKIIDMKNMRMAQKERLEREISIHKTLNHANIVQFFAIERDTAAGTVKLACQLASRSLSDLLLSREELTWLDRVRLTRNLAAALKFMETRGLEHRDVKAMNVLIGRGGNALLTDFGLTLPLGSAQSAQVEGSWPWMAPERFTGASGTACDVFSFGMTMWEIAARDIPYRTEGYTVDGIEAFVGAGRRLPVPYDTPKRFAEVMMACLDADPCARPSLGEVIEQLAAGDDFIEADSGYGVGVGKPMLTPGEATPSSTLSGASAPQMTLSYQAAPTPAPALASVPASTPASAPTQASAPVWPVHSIQAMDDRTALLTIDNTVTVTQSYRANSVAASRGLTSDSISWEPIAM